MAKIVLTRVRTLVRTRTRTRVCALNVTITPRWGVIPDPEGSGKRYVTQTRRVCVYHTPLGCGTTPLGW